MPLRSVVIKLALAIVCTTQLSCRPTSPAVGAGDAASVEAEVRAAVSNMLKAERERDADAVLDFLAPSFYMYGDARRADYSSVQRQIATTLPTLREFQADWRDIEVVPLGSDHALVSFVFVDNITAADGTMSQAWGANTFVWQRFENGWKLIYTDADHYPGTPPGP